MISNGLSRNARVGSGSKCAVRGCRRFRTLGKLLVNFDLTNLFAVNDHVARGSGDEGRR
jgi:hypothetical protein